MARIQASARRLADIATRQAQLLAEAAAADAVAAAAVEAAGGDGHDGAGGAGDAALAPPAPSLPGPPPPSSPPAPAVLPPAESGMCVLTPPSTQAAKVPPRLASPGGVLGAADAEAAGGAGAGVVDGVTACEGPVPLPAASPPPVLDACDPSHVVSARKPPLPRPSSAAGQAVATDAADALARGRAELAAARVAAAAGPPATFLMRSGFVEVHPREVAAFCAAWAAQPVASFVLDVRGPPAAGSGVCLPLPGVRSELQTGNSMGGGGGGQVDG